MKKLLGMALATMMVLGSAAHGLAAENQTLALVVSTLNNPFFVTLKDGAQKEADKLGYKLVVLDSQNDSARELANVEDVLNRHVALLMINPTDSDAVRSSIRAANRADVSVITLDRGASGGEVVAHVASDNVQGGEMAAQVIDNALSGKGRIVELEGVPGTSAARDRGEGFKKGIDAAPGLEIIASQPANFDRTQGLNVMENILQAQPDINAVFAQNDEMALGAIRAVQPSGRNIVVVGFDGTDDGIAAVKDGSMLATIAQQPAQIGALGVQTADKVLKGETVPAYIPVPLQVIDK